MSTVSDMQEAETPDELVKNFLSNLERRHRNLVKRKSKLDGYREKLQKGESLKDEQRKAVESYDGVVQNISFVQEVVTQTKDLLSNMETLIDKQMSQLEVEHEKHTLSYLSMHICLQRFLSSLDIPTVRAAVAKSSSENSLKLLDAVRGLLTPPVVGNWPGASSAALTSTPNFLQTREDLKAVAANTYDFTVGRPVPILLPNDMDDFGKKRTTFKDVRNLCFRLLANSVVQQSMGLIEECETVGMAEQKSSAAVEETTPCSEFPEPVEIPIPQHDYRSVADLSHTSPTAEPVDQVLRPLSSTFNFIQASKVVHPQIPVEHPTGFVEMMPVNQVPNKSVSCFNNHNLEEDNTDHPLINRLEQQYVLEVPETEPPKNEFCERSPSLPSGDVVRQLSPLKANIVRQDDADINDNGTKPISYADSVRKIGYTNPGLHRQAGMDNVFHNKRIDRVFEDNIRELEQPDQNFPRGNSKVSFRGRIASENRGGRGSTFLTSLFNFLMICII
ncbi:unnamed protein product [Heterobilharzia americana]|nr:unnamed protein product [Heterobilharzia americana]CAH8549656.1 unnamed protein product [Heterobilharzia americana]